MSGHIGAITFTSKQNDNIMGRIRVQEHSLHPQLKLDNESTSFQIYSLSISVSSPCILIINGKDRIEIQSKKNIYDLVVKEMLAETEGVSISLSYQYGDTRRAFVGKNEIVASIEGESSQGQGENGATFIPNVDTLGNISWTNDKGLVNPSTRNIKGPVGNQGANGITPKVAIGTVETLQPGSQAFVSRTGTDENPVFNFGIPKGADGAPGEGSGEGVSQDSLDTLKSELVSQIENPVGEKATFNSAKINKNMSVGARGPVGPPNFNNFYSEGSIYMGPQSEMPAITGPGAVGGNIYLPAGKAMCGLTKEGPIAADPDNGIAADSGVRTIAFVGKVTDEDVVNNETSVYMGTDVSRLYLYSRTAYPTIVSKTEALVFDERTRMERKATVTTNSPVATQEWVGQYIRALGLVGGQVDNTKYISSPVNPNQAFELSYSNSWSTPIASWVLSDSGEIGHARTAGKVSWVPLFQNTSWNDLYMRIDPSSTTSIDFLVAETPSYAYGVSFGDKVCKTFSIDRAGKRYFDYQSANPINLDANQVTRLKYDSTNRAYVFSLIDSNNNETVVLEIPFTSFNGFQEFSNAEPRLGLCYNVSLTKNKVLSVVDRPEGFNPSIYATNPYAVVRQSEKNEIVDKINTIEEAVSVRPGEVRISQNLDEYINKIVEERVNEILNKKGF